MLGFLFFRGIGIRMTEPIYLSPSFDNVLPGYLFLQVSIKVRYSRTLKLTSENFPPYISAFCGLFIYSVHYDLSLVK